MPEETTGDRRIHRLSYRDGDPLLKKMNRDAKKFWRDQATPTANTGPDVERTVFVLPNPTERGRYELRENDNGTISVIWTSPSVGTRGLQGPIPPGTAEDQRTTPVRGDPMHGFIPLGASGQGPVVRSSSPPSRTSDSDIMRAWNARNKAYWDRGPR